ncbi:hypothetical protein [Rhodobacter ferrooxidans]|uniref:Excalibur calcium-binding domain-containing protein n=1 Tax=Rhodobacter ferrooxidans TaxID=371731 RepID=C8RXQ3_9RHOB|nr:hypothetical protein [Rhodobacter sp. SW2]EEW26301.1 conserved hypothetical protein [Rhodobacter sp. SW2]
MRLPSVMLVALGLAACGPTTVPDSGAGFQDYPTYLRQREAALANGTSVAPATPEFSTQRMGEAINAAEGSPMGTPLPAQPAAGYGAIAQPGAGPLAADRPRGDAPMGIQQQSGEVTPGSAAISDEQDFSAVSSRETIQSDAERLARNRAQYQVIQPTALPERVGDTGPSIVQFALSTSHPVGTPMYKRSALQLNNPEKTCARFGSPDKAQEEFLASGGPEKDRKGIDPDGDGYACSWDPRPFRAALN